jgi:hypothetical protein
VERRGHLATAVGLVIASSVLGALASGCGGNKNPADAYVARASSLCKAEGKKLNSVKTPTSPADLRRYLGDVLPIIEKSIGDLQTLDPPSTLRSDHDQVIALTKTGARMIAAWISKLDGGADPSVVAAGVKQLDSVVKSVNDIWTRLGVEDCALGLE